MALRAIIVDDEEMGRNSLSALLTQFCPEVNIVAITANVPEAVLAINRENPHIVFLDIEMPEYNGFELLGFFREINFEIIFVTAYNEHVLKAFEVSAIDYLLKPVDIEKLKSAVQKAGKIISRFDQNNRIELLKESLHSARFNKIALPVAGGLLFIDTNDIMYLEAEGAYTQLWLKSASKMLVSKKLRFFEDVLNDKPQFFRSHRSFIVNINFIKKYNRAENSILLDNGKTVTIARERKAEFEAQLKDNNLLVG